MEESCWWIIWALLRLPAVFKIDIFNGDRGLQPRRATYSHKMIITITNNRSNTMHNDQSQWTQSMWPLNKDQYCPQWPRNNYQWQWTKIVANEQWAILSTSLTKDCKEQWANSLRWFDMCEGRWIRQNDAICVCILKLIYAWFDLVPFHRLSCN